MIIHHGGIVHFVDMVAGKDHHIVRVEALNKVYVLINGIGSALIPAAFLVMAFIGGQNLGAAMGLIQAPGLTVADVFVQFKGLILGEDPHRINAGVYAVTQREVDDAVFTAEGDGGLGCFLRQNL